jgi:hypothetical protein
LKISTDINIIINLINNFLIILLSNIKYAKGKADFIIHLTSEKNNNDNKNDKAKIRPKTILIATAILSLVLAGSIINSYFIIYAQDSGEPSETSKGSKGSKGGEPSETSEPSKSIKSIKGGEPNDICEPDECSSSNAPDPCSKDPNAEGCQTKPDCSKDPNAEGCKPLISAACTDPKGCPLSSETISDEIKFQKTFKILQNVPSDEGTGILKEVIQNIPVSVTSEPSVEGMKKMEESKNVVEAHGSLGSSIVLASISTSHCNENPTAEDCKTDSTTPNSDSNVFIGLSAEQIKIVKNLSPDQLKEFSKLSASEQSKLLDAASVLVAPVVDIIASVKSILETSVKAGIMNVLDPQEQLKFIELNEKPTQVELAGFLNILVVDRLTDFLNMITLAQLNQMFIEILPSQESSAIIDKIVPETLNKLGPEKRMEILNVAQKL